MLFRFREAQAADMGIVDLGRMRRPRNITETDSIPACEKWRGQVLKEISRKVSRIQDASLSDFQIRDLNDEINKLMREKHVWELQIRNLGGPNYSRGGARVYDDLGREVSGGGGQGGKGYKYFGRARELPGVKELFEAEMKARDEEQEGKEGDKVRAEGLQRMVVDARYYGYGVGEEDAEMLAFEKEKEAEREKQMRESGTGAMAPDGWESLPGDDGAGSGAWNLPSLAEVEEELIDRRRRKLLAQYQ